MLSQQDDSIITDKDRKVEALIQLHENSLLKMQNFELTKHKKEMSEYMRGRDFLITELYDEIWIQQNMNKEKDSVIIKQENLIQESQLENQKLRKKLGKRNTIIVFSIGFNLIFILGALALN